MNLFPPSNSTAPEHADKPPSQGPTFVDMDLPPDSPTADPDYMPFDAEDIFCSDDNMPLVEEAVYATVSLSSVRQTLEDSRDPPLALHHGKKCAEIILKVWGKYGENVGYEKYEFVQENSYFQHTLF